MSSDIRAWLNSTRSFAIGVQLYRKHGSDAAFIHRLQQGETSTLKKELFHALKGLMKPAEIDAPVYNCNNVNIITPAAYPAAAPENEASLQAKKDADLLYAQMCNARAQLLALCPLEEGPADRDPEAKAQRGRLAREVMDLQRVVDKAYDDYRYALQHGQRRQKPEPVAEEVDPVLLGQTIMNLRKSISRWRNKKQTPSVAQTLLEKEQLLTQYLEKYDQAKTRRS